MNLRFQNAENCIFVDARLQNCANGPRTWRGETSVWNGFCGSTVKHVTSGGTGAWPVASTDSLSSANVPAFVPEKKKESPNSFSATRPFLSPRGFVKKKERKGKEEREERKGIAERGDVTSCRRPTGTAGNEWKGLCASIFSGVVNPLAAWPVLTALNSVNVLPRVLSFCGEI